MDIKVPMSRYPRYPHIYIYIITNSADFYNSANVPFWTPYIESGTMKDTRKAFDVGAS